MAFQAGKDAWLADWVWLKAAKHVVLSPSSWTKTLRAFFECPRYLCVVGRLPR